MLVKIFKSKLINSSYISIKDHSLKLMLCVTDFNTLKEIPGHDASVNSRLQQLSKPNMQQQHRHFCGSLMLKWLKFMQLKPAVVFP